MRHMQVLNALAIILGFFALTMFVPLAISWHYQDGAQLAYDEAILLALGSALLLWIVTRRRWLSLPGSYCRSTRRCHSTSTSRD